MLLKTPDNTRDTCEALEEWEGWQVTGLCLAGVRGMAGGVKVPLVQAECEEAWRAGCAPTNLKPK